MTAERLALRRSWSAATEDAAPILYRRPARFRLPDSESAVWNFQTK